ncbi:MAG: hypothetical protein O7C98_01670, partial [Planctomycetota bacterium]|nr:hypothetical protein [Planctomycetota bacterium]
EIFAPATDGAIFFGDTQGVGVIDVDSARTPYFPVGTNPSRPLNTVVTTPSGNVVKVVVTDLVDITTDQRSWTAFHTFICVLNSPTMFWTTVYAASRTENGGEVVVIDSFQMTPLGRFATPSPGGIGITSVGFQAFAAVSNFSANTVTVFDINNVHWDSGNNFIGIGQGGGLQGQVINGTAQLILSEEDFARVFPHQRADLDSPPGPPILGTVNAGISPTAVAVSGFPSSYGIPTFPCFGPFYLNVVIMGVLNAGESTVDFSELTNLAQNQSLNPDLDGVTVSSTPVDFDWTPVHGIGSYYAFITAIGGTVELFQTGFFANRPSVLTSSSSNFNPNKIINNISGFKQPSGVQWVTNGLASNGINFYSLAALVAETSENRIQQVAVASVFPNLFTVSNANHVAGLGPTQITLDPNAAGFGWCGPRSFRYYVANTGSGNVLQNGYSGPSAATTIEVPGIQRVASIWSR